MRLATVLAAAALTALPATAQAAPTLDGSFAPSDAPGQIANGPDGAVWFTLPGGATEKDFGRIAPDGTITEFDTPGNVSPRGITAGPDVAGGPTNRVWLSFNGGVAKIDPANPGAAQQFAIATINTARDIAPDGDGNLWVVDDTDGLVKVAPNGTKLADVAVAGSSGRDIVLGGDGRMWWADFGGSAIQATTTAGVTTKQADLTTGPQGIAAGPQAQVAFGQPSNLLGRLTGGGSPQLTTDLGSDAGFGIVLGGDGAYWATRFAKDGLGRLTPAGAYSTPIQFPAGSGPRNIATGPNGTLWVVLETTKRIARVSGVTPPPGTNPTPPAVPGRDTVKPRMARLKVNGAKRRLSVRLSEAATLRIAVERRVVRRSKGKRRVRYVRVRFVQRKGKAGANTVNLGRKLKAARYRVSVRAVDTAGNRSALARKGFTVKKPRKKTRR